MGRIDMTKIDTTPGSGHWAAPPDSVDDYNDWLRAQYRTRRDVSQYLAVTARLVAVHRMVITYSGPYAREAEIAIHRLNGRGRR